MFDYIPQKLALAACLTLTSVAALKAQETRTVLTSESAKAMVAGCEGYARENSLNVSIAVLDQGKNLIAFLRMEAAPVGSVDVAQWKANGAAAFPRATKGNYERAKDFPALGHAPNFPIFEGGEAVFAADGTHLGGVGVSGAASADDAACARAGIAAAGLRHQRTQ